MKSDVARLCLGSAPYTLQNEPQKIIDCAHEAGIRWLDTASGYPVQCARSGWSIVTKLKADELANAGLQLIGSHVILAHEPKAEHLVRACKAAGYKGQIGVSQYWPDVRPQWASVVQWPLNLADRRYATSVKPYFTVFARSVFLQGKLLQMGYSVSDCLGFVLRQPVDYVVVGVNSVTEMEQIIRAANDLPETIPDIPAPKLTDKELDPRTWKV